MHLLKLFTPNDENAVVATTHLFDMLGVPVTKTTLQKELAEHPDYPSLLSISDVLTGFGVENISIKSSIEKIDKLPLPFIAQLRDMKSGQNVFTAIKKITEDEVECLSADKNKWISFSKDEFANRWTGIVLLAEASQEAGEKDFVQKRKEEKRRSTGSLLSLLALPFMASIATLFAFINDGSSAFLPVSFLFITLIGCFTGALLLMYEIGQHNPMLQQICGAGKKTNCNAILNSKASKIAGISWSAIGFSYFMGGLLSLLFLGITNPQTLFLLSWINVLALPYIIFSIYYQWRVAKQWCPLCLTVQALLVLQFITALAGGWHQAIAFAGLQPFVIIAIALAFLLPFLIVGILLRALQKAKESRSNKTALQRLKHNPQIFYALLEKQKALTESPAGLGLALGSPNATHKIIKVCNPYCDPCAKAHSPMEELLHNNPDIQVQIIFTATNDEKDIAAQPVKHLLAIAEKENGEIVKQSLDDWYLADKKDYEVFANKYPMNGELQKQADKIEAMHQWCDKTGIQFTPTFFVKLPSLLSLPKDGEVLEERFFQLPEMYSVNDIKYFLSV